VKDDEDGDEMIQRLSISHTRRDKQQQQLIAAWWAAIDALQRRTWTNREPGISADHLHGNA